MRTTGCDVCVASGYIGVRWPPTNVVTDHFVASLCDTPAQVEH